MGQPARLGEVFGSQQVEGGLGGVEAAGGIEARAEAESEVHGARSSLHSADVLEGAEAGVAGGFQFFQSFGDEEAIFCHERHNVSHRAEGDEVEQVFEQAALRRGAARFEQGMSQFEGEPGGA